MADPITALCQQVSKEAVSWRRRLHELPELGFQEFKTSEFIESQLRAFGGIEVWRPTPTGVVGILQGQRPGKTVAFRADIDALPIREDPALDPCSHVDGVMHACGHDGHTATLLGTAKVLSRLREQLAGKILFLFQPAEECPPGGAAAFVKAGVLNGVDMIFGMHYHVPEDPGVFLVKPGPLFASTYSFDIQIIGKGAHAAFPQSGVDTVLLASNVVVALNGIIPRSIDNAQRCVLTVTGIQSACSYNSIPDVVHLLGTIRMLDRRCEAELLTRVREVVQGLCSIYHAQCEIDIRKGYDLVESTPRIAEAVRSVLAAHFGSGKVIEPVPLMGGEDFSAYLHEVPGCYFRAGTRKVKPDGSVAPPHSGGYQFNDESLPYAIEAQTRILLEVPAMIE